MSETTDTSAIDEKNEEANNSSSIDLKAEDIVNFIKLFIALIIVIGIYFVNGSLLLYACKLGQANILPTEKNCAPYSDIKPNIEKVQSNIFTTTINDQQTGKAETYSKKINFPYSDYNSSNYVLDMFRNYKNKNNSHFLVNYLIGIIEPLIYFNYFAIDKALNMFNGFSEAFVILAGPIIVACTFPILLLADQFYILYLWFANMKWFFKTNTNDSGTGKPTWESVSITSPVYFWIGLLFVFAFCILFFFSLPLLSVLVGFTLAWCSMSCLGFTSELNGEKLNNAFHIIKGSLKYHKSLIMWTFSILLIFSAFSRLGLLFGIISLITFLLVFYKIIPIDLFAPIPKDILSKDGFTGFISNIQQAKKTCSFTEPIKKKHGFLYNLLIGQKGGGIANEIKNLSKKK
jgi:hypothetical protein